MFFCKWFFYIRKASHRPQASLPKMARKPELDGFASSAAWDRSRAFSRKPLWVPGYGDAVGMGAATKIGATPQPGGQDTITGELPFAVHITID